MEPKRDINRRARLPRCLASSFDVVRVTRWPMASRERERDLWPTSGARPGERGAPLAARRSSRQINHPNALL